jgi:hypothetical protein
MDGNYGGTMELRLAAADTIIYLDLPPPLCLWRVFLRFWRYRGRSRPDVAAGCGLRAAQKSWIGPILNGSPTTGATGGQAFWKGWHSMPKADASFICRRRPK